MRTPCITGWKGVGQIHGYGRLVSPVFVHRCPMLRFLLIVLAPVLVHGATVATAVVAPAGLGIESKAESQSLQQIATLAAVPSGAAADRMAGFLTDRSPTVRRAAFTALQKRPDDQLKRLIQTFISSPDAHVRAAGSFLVPQVYGADGVAFLCKSFTDASRDVRWAAARALRESPIPQDQNKRAIWNTALDSMLTGDLRLRRLAVDKIATLDSSDEARRILLKLLRGQYEEIADLACAKLLILGEAPDPLIDAMAAQLVSDPEPRNRLIAAAVLQRIASDRAVETLLKAMPLQSGPKLWETRAAIADAVGTINTSNKTLMQRVEKTMLGMLDDVDVGPRLAAAWALGRMGSAHVVPAVISRLGKRDHVHLTAMLRSWTGLPYERQQDWVAWYNTAGRGVAPTFGGVLPERTKVTYFTLSAEVGSVAYILDTSGSMAEQFPNDPAYAKMAMVPSKIESAKRELWRSVSMLNPRNRFAMVLFSTDVRPWKDGSLSAGWRARWKLWVELEANAAAGATNSIGALQAALDQTGCDTGFFLTDGMPTNGDILDPGLIIAEITARNHEREQKLALHTVAFLIPQAEGFLSLLAAQNAGTYELQR